MNEPAFPVPMIALTQEGEHPDVRYSGQSGMTLLDYFAAHATDADLEPHLPTTPVEAAQRIIASGIDPDKTPLWKIWGELRVRARWAHAAEMLRQRDVMMGGETDEQKEARQREEMLTAMGRAGV
jgi:hypothetical protein